MRAKTFAGAAFSIFWLLAQCLGQGTVQIGFEGPPPQALGTFSIILQYYEAGMGFRNPYGPENLALIGPASSGYADDGTAWLGTSLGGTLVFSFTNGTPFSLLSLDLAQPYTNSLYPITVQMVGYRLDGGQVTNSFTIDSLLARRGSQLPDFQTFSPDPAFADLVRVEVLRGGFALDSVLLGIPEPGTGTLLGVAAALLAVRYLSRKRQVELRSRAVSQTGMWLHAGQ